MTDPADPLLPPEPDIVPPPRRGGRILLVVVGLLLVLGLGLYLLSFAGVSGDGMSRIHILPTMQEHRAAVADMTDAPAAAPVPFDAGQVAALGDELEQLRQRVDALEHRPPGVPQAQGQAMAASGDTAPATARLDANSARIDQLAMSQVDLAGRVQAAEGKLAATANLAGALDTLTKRTARLARVQAAQIALAEGAPLGEVPGAPAALARFHSEAPPTEAQLRLAFPAMAASALAATGPETAKLGFWQSVRARLAALVTIRRGDKVLIGNNQVGIIDQARTLLDAGDLAGAVTELETLDKPAAASFADWCGRARALLEARAALAKLADQS